MEKIFIPIGVDCGTANVLAQCNKRFTSLPFDWVVSYNGVSDIIKTNFCDYLPKPDNTSLFCPESHTLFLHNTFPSDYETLNRRIKRFESYLECEDKEMIFIRKGHFVRHHGEVQKYNSIIKNDIEDSEDLYKYLKETYPKLNFQIVVFIACNNCFDHTKEYKSDNIVLINLSDRNLDFEKNLYEIVKAMK